jgi:hypothetical protein
MKRSLENTAIPCGSELARDSGVSGKWLLDVPKPSRAIGFLYLLARALRIYGRGARKFSLILVNFFSKKLVQAFDVVFLFGTPEHSTVSMEFSDKLRADTNFSSLSQVLNLEADTQEVATRRES